MMLKEAGDFAGHLKRMEKDIRGLKTATEGEQLCQWLHVHLESLGQPNSQAHSSTGTGDCKPSSDCGVHMELEAGSANGAAADSCHFKCTARALLLHSGLCPPTQAC